MEMEAVWRQCVVVNGRLMSEAHLVAGAIAAKGARVLDLDCEDLGELTGLPPAWVSEALEELEWEGWLRVESPGRYALVHPFTLTHAFDGVPST